MTRLGKFTALFLIACLARAGLGISEAALLPSILATRNGERLVLSWTASGSDHTYTVESTTNLVSGSWAPLGGSQGWPTASTEWSVDAPSAPATFFRVRVTVPVARGVVETNILLQRFTSAELLKRMQELGVPAFSAMPADAYKVVYRTVDPAGGPTTASALLVVPQGATRALPLVAYQHGTVMEREDVPSRLNTEGGIGLVLAAFGYIAVLPDYLGLGDSPGIHPYHHAASEATAVVDALRAARDSMTGKGAAWNKQLFLTGYSQGGHATLAAQRELELRHADELPITASAPCAGAHDLSGTTTTDFLSGRAVPNPYYFAYFLAAYTEVYGLAPRLADLLRPPYDVTLPPLFDGRHSSGEINALMPAKAVEILKPEILDAFVKDPNHPLRVAIRDNDLHSGWFPKVKTRFYHCSGDLDVLPANSKVAFDAFKAAGAPAVELNDPFPGANHGGCAAWALLGTKFWFDGMKQ